MCNDVKKMLKKIHTCETKKIQIHAYKNIFSFLFNQPESDWLHYPFSLRSVFAYKILLFLLQTVWCTPGQGVSAVANSPEKISLNWVLEKLQRSGIQLSETSVSKLWESSWNPSNITALWCGGVEVGPSILSDSWCTFSSRCRIDGVDSEIWFLKLMVINRESPRNFKREKYLKMVCTFWNR